MSNGSATPGPWDAALGSYGKGRVREWTPRVHEFQNPPYEGDLVDEWGIYPPLGEPGPVALVAGEENARLIVRAVNTHYDLLAACEEVAAWIDEPGKGRALLYPHLADVILPKLKAAIAAAKGETP